ncbi:MAG: hypothetical protein JNJ48_01000 [Phycisphaerae bacterium]|nr:hypothetical protein [Phycisphaerae bacterium]
MFSLSTRGALIGAAALAAASGTLLSMTLPAGNQPSAAAPAAAPDKAARAAAVGLARVALVDLRAISTPGAADYRVCDRVLAAALRLTPDDEDLVRLAIDAATQGGDRERLIALTRDLLRLRPDDTVAQLRLISAQIDRAQDVRARLALYDNFLGPRGESLDASIRSRLALDAALLLRENGDADGFVDRLRLAVRLDPTNKDSAALAYSFFSQRVDDPQARVETLIALMNADPTDPAYHETLARELAQGGAHAASLRFYRNAGKISDLLQRRLDVDVIAGRMTQQWLVEGAEGVLSEVNTSLNRQRTAAEAARKRAEELGIPLRNLPDPATMRIALEAELVRLMAASASGDGETEAASLADMAGSVGALRDQLADPSKRPQGATEERIRADLAFWDRELLGARLLTGKQTEEAVKQFEELAKNGAIEDEPALRALLLLRQGKAEEAEAALKPLVDVSVLARIGLGLVAEAKPDAPGAAKVYADAWRSAPGGLLGAWARTKAAALGGDIKPAESAARLEAMASGVPAWIDEMAVNPRRFEVLSAATQAGELRPGEKALITVRLRNTSPIALGVGPDRTINSRFLVAPSVSAPGVDVGAIAAPEVVNLDRRLRLMPREEMVVTVWAEPGYGGWALEQVSNVPMRVRWRLEQGFRVDSMGASRASGLGLSTETPGVVRHGPAGAEGTLDSIIAAVESASSDDLVGAVAAVRLRALGAVSGLQAKLTPDEFARLGAALLARYQREGAVGRMLMLTGLPTGRREPGMLVFDRAIRPVQETDADVLLAKIITRADEPDSPILDAGIASSDATVKSVAEAVRERLKAGVRGYARLNTLTLSGGK